jgi:hypothetical protein
MPPPIPRCSNWAYSSLNSPSCFSLPRYGSRIGLHIFLFEACSTFTRVAACTLALSPIRDTLIEGFSHFVTSMTAPIASGWSGCRVGLAPTGKRRLCTAHAKSRSRPALVFLPPWRAIERKVKRLRLTLDFLFQSGNPSFRRFSAIRFRAAGEKTIACLNFETVRSG